MIRKYYTTHRGQRGITGLETAIILIAFVVVAAVFAYTALTAGLFSTQKAQEAVYSGLKEAQSSLELRGGVIATANITGSTGNIKQISFVVSNVLQGEPIDFTEPTVPATPTGKAHATTNTNKIVINYIDENQTENDLFWTITKLGNTDDDDLLEDGEKFRVTIGAVDAGSGAGNLIDALGTYLSVNTQFSLIIQTPVGAVLEIERTIPPYIDTIMNLR